MRIVAGDLKGRTFVAPTGQDTRPTTDRVREAVFSTLYSELGSWRGLRVLDLFAGSGAFGFEALSRGAEFAVGVDDGRAAQKAIALNVKALGLEDRYQLVARDARRAAGQVAHLGPFGLVFLDPPYAVSSEVVCTMLSSLSEAGCFAPGAVIGYEHERKTEAIWPPAFESLRTKEYGYSSVSYAIYRGETASGPDADSGADRQLAPGEAMERDQ